jgi:predicted O-methyltransferase YrrM
MPDLPVHVPPGHAYSPLPSRADIERARRRADVVPRTLPGIELRDAQQRQLLAELAHWYGDLPFGVEPGPHRFRYGNSWFTYADAVLMALMLRRSRPTRIIELGCGYSSALLLDVNDLFLGRGASVTFIEPDAARLREVLSAEDLDGRLIEAPVQDVDLELFDELAAGDVLAIDGSHVVKAGSDVQHVFDEVLPRLAPGVLVHMHDVFYPFEYPASWLEKGCALNEAYVLRAFLQSTTAYRIELFTDYLLTFHHDWLAEHLPLVTQRPFPTGGIWLSRT